MYKDRRQRYAEFESERDSKIIVYVTGDRRGLETQIAHEVLDFFVDHLDIIGVTHHITLYLYTRGGDTLAAWSLANLLRTFCDRLDVVIPAKAHSAGTLIALASENIVMTKQAALGPIDPSVTGPLNPPVPNAQPTNVVPVSVEAVGAFVEFARDTLGEEASLEKVFLNLAQQVHPMVLGNAYRARGQIRMLGERLLMNHLEDEAKIGQVLDFLCSQSGSHDYTINRREARGLGLPIEVPSQKLYRIIKKIYDDIVGELELRTPYDPAIVVGANLQCRYRFPRVLIESVDGGSHVWVSEGQLSKQRVQRPDGIEQDAVTDQRQFEGWRHEHG